MGGTWVSHHYAYLLKEMTRYNMDRDLIVCHASGSANDYFTITVPGEYILIMYYSAQNDAE